MSILATFAVYSNPEVAARAIQSLGTVSKFFPVNNPELYDIVKGENHIINIPGNYCNGAWNQAMKMFLDEDKWDYLLLSSADVIMQDHWYDNIKIEEDEILLPHFVNSLENINAPNPGKIELKGNPAGACTLLPKKAVRTVYPIPSQLRLWFGDEYMYGLLREKGWKITQGEFNAYHYGSLGIQSNSDNYKVIEEDKIAWRAMGRHHD